MSAKGDRQQDRRSNAFLLDVANVRRPEDYKRLISKYSANFFPGGQRNDLREALVAELGQERVKMLAGLVGHSPLAQYLRMVAFGVQGVWKAPDIQTALWRWVFLRHIGARLAGVPGDPHEPPPWSPFEEAMLYLHRNWHRARYCPNPDCPAPYFFLSRKGQQYCSDVCAQFGQREAKKRWWARRGEQWRKRRGRKH